MKRLLHYEIAEKLGEGKNGITWSAIDSTSQRAVVIKEMRRPHAADEAWRQRFLASMEQINALEHAGIARFYALEEADGCWFVARQYVDGQDVSALAISAPVEYDRWLNLALELACTLKSIHDTGLVHGNVTSSNVFVDSQGRTRLVDSGLGAIATGLPNAEQSVFLAPELSRGAQATPSGDLYALGVVLYHLLTGQIPQGSPPVVFSQFSEQQAPGVARLLLGRLLAASPGERFASAEELILTIQAMMSLETEPATVERRKWSLGPRQYLMISVLVLLLVILWLVVTSQPK
ncbi:MAG: serine/threonine-protein kinase [Candidatus Zixiibacteriota bacterium]